MLSKENRAKLVVMGAEGVGKTSILRRFFMFKHHHNIIIITIFMLIITITIIMINIRFLFDKFQHRHKPTVEEMYSRDFVINDCGLRSPFIIVSQANIM